MTPNAGAFQLYCYAPKEKAMEKPPLGLTPKSIHDQGRAVDILEAMKRYVYADKPIPVEWIDELRRLYGEA